MIRLRYLIFAGSLACTAPAVAMDAKVATPAAHTLASVLTPKQRADYADVFAAIRQQDWSGAAARLDAMEIGPLHAAARAELYLAKGSPAATQEQLLALLAAAPELPDAEQLGRLARTRGAVDLPALPAAQKLVWQGSQPRRTRPKSASADPLAAKLDALIQPLIKDNRPAEAELILQEHQAEIGAAALPEFQQRIAWSYYIVGDDRSARRLADHARQDGGDWGIQAAWVSGLASWRLRDCAAASDAFATVGGRSGDVEMFAAGNYWAARADMMCQRPERVQQRLRTAARLKETFYGILASRALGISTPGSNGLHDYRDSEWRPIAVKPNVRAAIALDEIGRSDLADAYIRHQARIGDAADHAALLHLASDLNLAGTQFWLAHNAPRGASVNFAARYPMPQWQPVNGWRVDPNLAFAHALQESNFRAEAVSPAGAVGLMQVLPGTAGGIARKRGQAFNAGELTRPATNMEFGQSYMEYLRDYPATGGLLPKVIAAYNCGPAPVAEWNARAIDKGDPLLYIESLPYWETRGYVPIVLRNYWIYEQQAGKEDGSRGALVQGMWPRFPGLPGAKAVRLNPPAGRSIALGTK